MYTLLHNVARKLVIMEIDLERAEERAVQSDRKIVELEEELRVVGNNLKSLEVSEEKANQREEEYKNQIKNLTTRLKEVLTFSYCLCATLREEEYTTTLKSLDNQLKEAAATRDSCEDKIHIISDKLREAEARAEFAERSVQKLQKEVDRLEDDLLVEKERNKQLADEMEATLHDIQNM
ncbi:tropomyosin [Holotrichia oblita]|uniref:Tropomyosin n=1 Tax=Holotrichia oblita TaxID=644536 RepID=A0ACB9SWG3_HOLOL|nr:tropomyosin [Holotrichia oblita]